MAPTVTLLRSQTTFDVNNAHPTNGTNRPYPVGPRQVEMTISLLFV
jgi:hypothetical protein